MTRNPVMNLWTAVVTAFLALCTSLGLITTTAVAAVPEEKAARNADASRNFTAPEEPVRTRPHASSLPPTMKQRIHAEAHGSSPSCRHRPPTDSPTTDTAATHDGSPAPAAAPVTSAPAATAVLDAMDSTDSTAGPAGATHSTAGAIGGTDRVAAPVGLPGPARGTTGVLDRRTVTARPATESGGELPGRTENIAGTSDAPAADSQPVDAFLLPSQASAPVHLPAPFPAPAPAPASAPVLAGAAARG